MTKQAQVGAFALVALLLLFGVFYLITDFGTRHTGYRIGVHFQSAAGLTTGALVYFSGVNAGSVDSVELLPDNTVDVILAIKHDIDVPQHRVPDPGAADRNPALVIIPPRQAPPLALLPREVLPIAQQPRGTNGVSIADLLAEGQGEIKRLNRLMALMEERTPKLLNTLQSTLDNANALTISTRSQLAIHSAALCRAASARRARTSRSSRQRSTAPPRRIRRRSASCSISSTRPPSRSTNR